MYHMGLPSSHRCGFRTELDYKGVYESNQYVAMQKEGQGTMQMFVCFVQNIEQSVGHRLIKTEKRILFCSDSHELNTD